MCFYSAECIDCFTFCYQLFRVYYSTGVKRVLDGEIRLIVKGAESKMNVKYTTLPSNNFFLSFFSSKRT